MSAHTNLRGGASSSTGNTYVESPPDINNAGETFVFTKDADHNTLNLFLTEPDMTLDGVGGYYYLAYLPWELGTFSNLVVTMESPNYNDSVTHAAQMFVERTIIGGNGSRIDDAAIAMTNQVEHIFPNLNFTDYIGRLSAIKFTAGAASVNPINIDMVSSGQMARLPFSSGAGFGSPFMRLDNNAYRETVANMIKNPLLENYVNGDLGGLAVVYKPQAGITQVRNRPFIYLRSTQNFSVVPNACLKVNISKDTL